MLTTKEAIEKRRSIRKFKQDPIPDEDLMEILNAARLAPSGCNAQPWRFKLVKDNETKTKLSQAAYNQAFIAQAPVVIVCCADVNGYLTGRVSGIQDLGKIGAVEGRIAQILEKRTTNLKTVPIEQIGPQISLNVAIAVEHMVLRALDFGLGTCWIRLLDKQRINKIFRWPENIYIVALLPIGYVAEDPAPRKRMALNELLL
ncbi:MAG: nitroreductase family protein [Desulfobacterales bacterium]|jgi:nitroreductase